MRALISLLVLTAVHALSGCATTGQTRPHSDYRAFRAESPRSILVVPPTNRSVEVNAPDYFLTTIAVPLAERGYYVFPMNTVRSVLADDGLSDADLVHASDPRRLGELFGTDAVLYISIERWDARYVVLSTTVTVELIYVLKSCHSGEVLWKDHRTVIYTPDNNNSGGNPAAALVAALIKAAITKAVPNYRPLAMQANALAVSLKGTGLPAGPYSAMYQKDSADF
jgi:hypothetical protein